MIMFGKGLRDQDGKKGESRGGLLDYVDLVFVGVNSYSALPIPN